MYYGHILSPISFSYALLIFLKHIFPPSCFHAFAFVLNPWGLIRVAGINTNVGLVPGPWAATSEWTPETK